MKKVFAPLEISSFFASILIDITINFIFLEERIYKRKEKGKIKKKKWENSMYFTVILNNSQEDHK